MMIDKISKLNSFEKTQLTSERYDINPNFKDKDSKFAKILSQKTEQNNSNDSLDIPKPVRETIHSLLQGERYIDQVINQAIKGKDFSLQELIIIQAKVYRFTQELEFISKLVDKTSSCLRQAMNTNV
jgi:hypothetical protein